MTATFRFGRFELRPSSRQLLVDGQPATLGARAFDVLSRPALDRALDAEALARRLAAGAALGEVALFALIAEALAQPSRNRR